MIISLLVYFTLGVAGAFLIGYIWDHICYFFQKKVIPYVRRILGNTVADVLANIVMFANQTFTMPRRAIRASWDWFRHNVLKVTTTYDRKDDYVVVTDTIVQRCGDSQIKKIELQEQVHWLDLPTDVCVELDKLGEKGHVTIDSKEVLEQKYINQARNNGEIIELQN